MLLFTGDSPKHFTAECAHLEMNVGPPTFNSNRAAAIYLNSGVTSGVYCEVNGLAMLKLRFVSHKWLFYLAKSARCYVWSFHMKWVGSIYIYIHTIHYFDIKMYTL